MMVTIKLQKSDYLDAVKLHSTWSRKKIILLGGLILVLLLSAWILKGSGEPLISAAIIGGIVGCFIARGITQYIYIPWRTSRIFDQQKSLHRAFTVSWDENGVLYKEETGQTMVRWSDYLKYKDNEKIALLYHSDILFNMLPKKAFPTEESWQEFCVYVRREVCV